MTPNPEQQHAIERTGQDVCVVAGPGSGKTHVLTERFRWLASLNPVTGLISAFRSCLGVGKDPLDWSSLTVSCASALFLLVAGLWYFRQVEDGFADIV